MAQLRQHWNQFERLKTQVLVISFGKERRARAWLEDTGAPFPLLLDPQRNVYRAYGLGSSIQQVWSPKVLWYYLRLWAAGRPLRLIQGDPHQLGGDFIVDVQGIVRLAYRSRDPTDRPSVEMVLNVLRSEEKP